MQRKDASNKEDDFDAFSLGSNLNRAFLAEVGEEMCQAEVAHHANKSPEYFLSRPEKHVHLYKKALALSVILKETR